MQYLPFRFWFSPSLYFLASYLLQANLSKSNFLCSVIYWRLYGEHDQSLKYNITPAIEECIRDLLEIVHGCMHQWTKSSLSLYYYMHDLPASPWLSPHRQLVQCHCNLAPTIADTLFPITETAEPFWSAHVKYRWLHTSVDTRQKTCSNRVFHIACFAVHLKSDSC